MGGDALPFPTQRLSPDRYHNVSTRLLTLLSTHYALACAPAPCPGKSSHGDVDILVALPYADRPFDPIAQLGSRAVHQNGSVLSFEFEGHQADVIGVSEDKYEVSRLFYSYGDVGMILGMMLTHAGIKFGCKGLKMVRVDAGGQLHLSSDRSRILGWLGLDEAEWLAGFNDSKAVFRWLCSCRWFRHSMFNTANHHTSHHHTTHNKRRALSTRPMFTAFVHYVDSVQPTTAEPIDRPPAAVMRADAVAYFGCEAAVAAWDAVVAKRVALKQCWNGVLVTARTGLIGKQLGLFMMACRQLVTDDELLAMSVEEVQQFIDVNFTSYRRDDSTAGTLGDGGKAEWEESKDSAEAA